MTYYPIDIRLPHRSGMFRVKYRSGEQTGSAYVRYERGIGWILSDDTKEFFKVVGWYLGYKVPENIK